MSAQVAQPSETKQLLALLAQLAALTDAVTRLREAQDRAGQARAARQATQKLRAATAHYTRQDLPLNGPTANPPASGVGSRAPRSPHPFKPDPTTHAPRGPHR